MEGLATMRRCSKVQPAQTLGVGGGESEARALLLEVLEMAKHLLARSSKESDARNRPCLTGIWVAGSASIRLI